MKQITSDDLGSLAYKKVKAMIISKKLIPGKKIVQDKLAEELGISRTPLRAALQMLEAENLVQSIPRRGMVVKEFSNKEIIEIYDCRIAIEGTAVRLFAEVAEDKDVENLRLLFKPFKQGKIDVSMYQKADSKFHDAILAGCGNQLLNQLFQKSNLLTCIDMIGLVRPPEETLAEHMEIIDAIASKDLELAESLAKKHLYTSKELIRDKINGSD